MYQLRVIIALSCFTIVNVHSMDQLYTAACLPFTYLNQLCTPSKVHIPSFPIHETLEECPGTKTTLSDGTNLIQLNVKDQFANDGGGPLSCGYHSLKNALLITEKLKTGYPENLSEALNSAEIVQDFFGPSTTHEHIGKWRHSILLLRKLSNIQKNLSRAFDKNIHANAGALSNLFPCDILDQDHATSIRAGLKKMIWNYTNTLAHTSFINPAIYTYTDSTIIDRALTMQDASSSDLDIQYAQNFINSLQDEGRYNKLLWNVDTTIDTATPQYIDTENLTGAELHYLIEQEFAGDKKFFLTVNDDNLPEEKLFDIRRPIILENLNLLSEEPIDELVASQQEELMQKISTIKKRIQQREIQPILIGSMKHATNEDDKSSSGHWVSMVVAGNNWYYTDSSRNTSAQSRPLTQLCLEQLTN